MSIKLLDLTEEELEQSAALFKKLLEHDPKDTTWYHPGVRSTLLMIPTISKHRADNWIKKMGGAKPAGEFLLKPPDAIKALYQDVIRCIKDRIASGKITDKTLLELFKLSIGIFDGPAPSQTQVNVINNNIDDYLKTVDMEEALLTEPNDK